MPIWVDGAPPDPVRKRTRPAAPATPPPTNRIVDNVAFLVASSWARIPRHRRNPPAPRWRCRNGSRNRFSLWLASKPNTAPVANAATPTPPVTSPSVRCELRPVGVGVVAGEAVEASVAEGAVPKTIFSCRLFSPSRRTSTFSSGRWFCVSKLNLCSPGSSEMAVPSRRSTSGCPSMVTLTDTRSLPSAAFASNTIVGIARLPRAQLDGVLVGRKARGSRRISGSAPERRGDGRQDGGQREKRRSS